MLALAKIEGEPLSHADFLSTFLWLLVAGNETTRNSIAHVTRAREAGRVRWASWQHYVATARSSRFAHRCGASCQLGPSYTLNLSSDYLVVPEKVASIAAKAHAGSVFNVGWGQCSEPQPELSAE